MIVLERGSVGHVVHPEERPRSPFGFRLLASGRALANLGGTIKILHMGPQRRLRCCLLGAR